MMTPRDVKLLRHDLQIEEKCHCYDKAWDWQPASCCAKGLVCSHKTWTCEPALGGKCTRLVVSEVCDSLGSIAEGFFQAPDVG